MIIKEQLETKVEKECDVLVCGGGFAGISAALAAARKGKRVLLLEKSYILGGLGTSGLVTAYLPLCDGMGRQVSFGIAEELLRLSVSMGVEAGYSEIWRDGANPAERTDKSARFEAQYNPYLFAILAEKLLIKEGVELLYGSYAVAAHKTDGAIDAVIIENKSGRYAIAAGSVVDATGDCDIAYFAQAPTEEFKQGNVLAAWYYSLSSRGYKLEALGFCDVPDSEKKKNHSVSLLSQKRYKGLDGVELSQMTVESHNSTLNDIIKKRENDPSVIPTSIATIPQIRMTRRIAGEYTLNDTQQHMFFEDSIGLVSDWRKRGPVYEVPFSTLYSKKVKNLITAGRCISVTDAMWDIMRVIPCCAVTGQAAGTAASLTNDFSSLDVSLLQNELRKNGVVIHETELKHI